MIGAQRTFRSRRLAAPLLAAGVGMAVLAATHSLFDMPRVGFLLAFLLVLALALPDPRKLNAQGGRPGQPGRRDPPPDPPLRRTVSHGPDSVGVGRA